jgi:hypothetical protein
MPIAAVSPSRRLAHEVREHLGQHERHFDDAAIAAVRVPPGGLRDELALALLLDGVGVRPVRVEQPPELLSSVLRVTVEQAPADERAAAARCPDLGRPTLAREPLVLGVCYDRRRASALGSRPWQQRTGSAW